MARQRVGEASTSIRSLKASTTQRRVGETKSHRQGGDPSTTHKERWGSVVELVVLSGGSGARGDGTTVAWRWLVADVLLLFFKKNKVFHVGVKPTFLPPPYNISLIDVGTFFVFTLVLNRRESSFLL